LRQGLLCAEGVRGQAALRRDLVQLASARMGPCADAERRYLALGEGARRLHLAMQPLKGDAEGGWPAGSVLIAVSGAATDSPMPAQALAGLFQLTPAESQLLAALVGGASLASYAACRGVSLGTVRVQLKQVLGKTGASRQSELVRLVLSSAAAQLAPAQAITN
jgi:DNA-binding CsgD family transcriptional regulator